MEALFKVEGLKKYYDLGRRQILHAVDDVSFELYEGENLGVVGESGSGKSTLGRCLIGLIEPTGGTISYRGTDISRLKARDAKALRKEMQMVFQNPSSSFNPKKTLGKVLSDIARFYGLSAPEARARIDELLGYVNLDRHELRARSNGLSGGQLQRLALVRALLPDPKFIMADEPVSALDVSVQAQILALFNDMKTKFGLTMLFISHELTVVEHVCDRVIVMYLGRIVEMAPTKALFASPLHPYTRSLLASKPKEYPEEEKHYELLEGEIPTAVGDAQGCRFASRCPRAIVGRCATTCPPLVEVAPDHWVSCLLVEHRGGYDAL